MMRDEDAGAAAQKWAGEEVGEEMPRGVRVDSGENVVEQKMLQG